MRQKKRHSFVADAATLAVFFAILLPTTVLGATGSWCAQYRTSGDKFPTVHCFTSQAVCMSSVSNAVSGSVAAQCADVTQSSTITEPGQQRMVAQITEGQRRDAATAAMNEDNIFPLLLQPVAGILAGLAAVIFKIAGLFLTSMAQIMDWSISVSIDSQALGSMSFVNIGWTAVRDISNMFFIFAVLYIAIQTILGLAGGGAKRWLVHIIIAAIFINFSLFATKVVIDSGNILAVSFWNKIKTQQGPANITPGASAKILGGLDLQTVFAQDKRITLLPGGFSYGKVFLAYTGGAIFMFIAGYIFLAAALMMVTRTVMLLLLMIFSPFAFMALGLPKLEQYGHKWLDKLIKQTFVAPFFIFMLYLNSVLVDKFDIFSLSGSKGQSFAGALTGSGEYQIIFNFVLMIGFLIASLAIANSFAGDAGSHARGWAKSVSKWGGGLAAGGAVAGSAFAMRQSLGKIGMMSKDNEKLHEMSKEKGWRGMVGRGGVAITGGMARATYDPRATKIGAETLSGGGRIDIGQAGGKGGYEATGSALSKITLGSYGYTGTAHDKEVLEIAERRYANDPKGKEAYLRANLGSVAKTKKDEETGKTVVTERFASRYDESYEHKGLREKVDREIAIKEHKDNLRKSAKEYGDLQKAGQVGKDEIIDGKATGKKIGDAAAAVIKEALSKLNGKEAADTLNNEQLKLQPVIAALNSQHLAALNTRTDLNPETIAAITQGVVANGTNSAQKYLRNQSRLSTGNGLFQVDAEKELEQLIADYDKNALKLTDPATRTLEIEREQREMKDRAGRLLGMMETNEVAELDNVLITHDMLMEQYGMNSKIQQKIRERLKTGAYEDAVAQKLQARFGGQTNTQPPPPSPIIIPPGSRTA